MPPMTMGVISSTSSKSLRLLQVDMDAALSKYHGVFNVAVAAAKAFSESAMAQRAELRGGSNVDDRELMVEVIAGSCVLGDGGQ